MDLEKEVLKQVSSSVQEAIKSKLSGYSSPFEKFITEVVNQKRDEIKTFLGECIDNALFGDHKKELKDACSKKIGKVIVSKIDGGFEKKAQELMSNPEFKAKLTLVVCDLVNSFGKNDEKC